MIEMKTAFINACKSNGQIIEEFIVKYYKSRPSSASFFDGGCHEGYHSFRAAQHYQGRVISVDANAETYKKFTDNLAKLPKMYIDKVIPVYGAIQSDASLDKVIFNCSPSHPGRSSLNKKAWDYWGKGEVSYSPGAEIPALTIDQLVNLNNLSDVGFIKLDLEGGEYDALRGAEKTMKTQRPHIAMEYGINNENASVMGHSKKDVFDLMANRSYQLISPWGEIIEVDENYAFYEIFAVPVEDTVSAKEVVAELFKQFCTDKDLIP